MPTAVVLPKLEALLWAVFHDQADLVQIGRFAEAFRPELDEFVHRDIAMMVHVDIGLQHDRQQRIYSCRIMQIH